MLKDADEVGRSVVRQHYVEAYLLHERAIRVDRAQVVPAALDIAFEFAAPCAVAA